MAVAIKSLMVTVVGVGVTLVSTALVEACVGRTPMVSEEVREAVRLVGPEIEISTAESLMIATITTLIDRAGPVAEIGGYTGKEAVTVVTAVAQIGSTLGVIIGAGAGVEVGVQAGAGAGLVAGPGAGAELGAGAGAGLEAKVMTGPVGRVFLPMLQASQKR